MRTADSIDEMPSPRAESPVRRRPAFAALATVWLPALALLFGLQGYLAFREPIFSPIDELQHADYVRTVALQAQLPIYGEKQNDATLLSLYYHVYPGRVAGDRLAASPPSVRLNYEALQFPLFYIVAAPIYKLLAGDPRAAIYGVRLLNVALSGVLLVLLATLLRRTYGFRAAIAMAIALPIALIPGVALRGSQVINEVLAAVLLTALMIGLIARYPARPRLQAFVEGALVGLAIVTKLTAIAILPAVLLAWLTRGRGARTRLLAGLAGAALAIGPWLAWALPAYGSPVPFLARHPKLFDVSMFAPPSTLLGWLTFGKKLLYFFWLPWEWRVPAGKWEWLPRLAAPGASLVLGLAIGASVALVWRRPNGVRPVAIAGVTLVSFAASYAFFAAALHRVWPSDLRELYIFLGALALLIGPLASRLSHRVVLGASAFVLATWLVLDAGFYLLGHCAC